MIIFWILQSLINIVLVALAVSYVMQRRRLLRLEADLHRILLDNEGEAPEMKSSLTQSTLNTPLGAPMSTLSERNQTETTISQSINTESASVNSLSMSSRYALAQRLLDQGMGLSQVARQSGVSETELNLLRKCASPARAKKNYEAH